MPSGEIVKTTNGLYEDITVHANWTPIEYSVSYNLDGGTNNASNPNSYNYDSGSVYLADPYKQYYLFNGWYNSNNQKKTYIKASSDKDVSLTARWKAKTYYITYNNTMGASNPNRRTFTTDDGTIYLSDLNYNGLTFDGWYDDSGNKITQLSPSDETTNFNLTARWVTTYNITYTNLNGAVNNNPSTYTSNGGVVNLSDPILEGYAFEGWYDLNGNRKSSLDPNLDGNITLDARWVSKN